MIVFVFYVVKGVFCSDRVKRYNLEVFWKVVGSWGWLGPVWEKVLERV